MRDVAVAPKLAALKDLLMQCGVIGVEGDSRTEDESGVLKETAGPRRVMLGGDARLVI